jgi:hypothetical protein
MKEEIKSYDSGSLILALELFNSGVFLKVKHNLQDRSDIILMP